jgi:hypothetical protein
VLATELDPPAGAKPIEWLLLTTVPITGAAEARLSWYTCRWGSEVRHKLLTSGCQIAARQLATGERLERCMAVYSMIAWRVQWAVMLARTVPDLPCTALLEREEWEALWCTIHRDPQPPVAASSLGEAVRWLGRLGGHLGPEARWRSQRDRAVEGLSASGRPHHHVPHHEASAPQHPLQTCG